LAVDTHGNLVIADTGNSRVRVVADTSGTFYGVSMKAGDIYTIAGDGKYGYKGIGGKATTAKIGSPQGVTVDHNGNVVITDAGNERIYVVAVKTGTFYGQKMTKGDIYLIAGDGKTGYSGNKKKAVDAELDEPNLVSVDSSGNVVFPDSQNNVIRVIAVKTGTFYGIKMTAQDIYTVAGDAKYGYTGDGGKATSAKLGHPDAVAIDSLGNLVFTDSHNNVVRVVAAKTGTFYGVSMKADDIYTVAGDGTHGYSGDGGVATSAELANPVGIATISTGNAKGDELFIAESGNSRVREVSFAPMA
jgi:trimeric autotransporter adhesin